MCTAVANAQQPLSKRDQQRKAEFEAMIEAEKKYDELRAKADKAFREKNYAEARMNYAEAINYNKEDEQWLVSKVNDLDILMAEIVAREIDSVSIINRKSIPQIVLEEKGLPKEIDQREEVEVDTPEQEEDTFEEIAVTEEEVQNKEREPAKTELPDPVVEAKPQVDKPKPVKPIVTAPTEKPKEESKVTKELEDYSRFPQGRTDETFTFPDHTVRRIVIRDKRDVIVYKYVTHRWGGKFYFKDGVSIVERIWKQEVADYEGKFPENLAK